MLREFYSRKKKEALAGFPSQGQPDETALLLHKIQEESISLGCGGK